MAGDSIRRVASFRHVTMRIKINFSALGQIQWHEYVIRFVFGGLITAIAGIIAKKFGPTIGGLFLAFPAIFPASATLVEKHERQEKEKHGLKGASRGAEAASIEAAGTAIGSLGLLAFAFVVWKLLDHHSPWIVLIAATLVWLSVSILGWEVRKAI